MEKRGDLADGFLRCRNIENLLLMVIARQLKWIDVFGAILGALLGLVQILFRLIG